MFDPKPYTIKLKGKDYLPVAPRVAWFRDQHPQGSITTELVSLEPVPIIRATVTNGDGLVLATGFGTGAPRPNAVYAGREVEKAETAAIGRALAAAGLGTLQAGEFDDADDDHLADSPVNRKPSAPAPRAPEPAPQDDGWRKVGTVEEIEVRKTAEGGRQIVVHFTAESGAPASTTFNTREPFRQMGGVWAERAEGWTETKVYDVTDVHPAAVLLTNGNEFIVRAS